MHEAFNAKYALEILKIPLMNNEAQDELVGRLSKEGRYSVKFAKHQLMEHAIDSSNLHVPVNWKTLWNRKVSN